MKEVHFYGGMFWLFFAFCIFWSEIDDFQLTITYTPDTVTYQIIDTEDN